MTSLLLLLAFFAQTFPQNRAPVQANPSPAKYPASPAVDHAFALAATQANHAEIDLARLALRHAKASEVLGYASKMITEHEALAKDFQAPLARLLPSPPPERLAPPDRLAFQHLDSIPAADFDQEYIIGQIAGHLTTLTAFQTEAENGADPELKELARKWLPTIKSHLELAVDMTKHIGGSSPFKGS